MAADRPAVLNGRRIPRGELKIDVADAGFVYSATAVDVCRVRRGRPHRWPDHLDRFIRDCQALGVPLPYAAGEITAWAEFVSRGRHDVLVTCATPGPPGGPPTLLMHTRPLSEARLNGLRRNGANVRIAGCLPFHVDGLVDRRVKHRSRLHWWLADRDVRDGEIALLCDLPGDVVTETAVAAFLMVESGRVVSPPAERILDSVSLRAVREACGRLSIPFREREFTPDEVRSAGEAFLAGSVVGVVGVAAFDGTPLPCPGPVTARLAESVD